MIGIIYVHIHTQKKLVVYAMWLPVSRLPEEVVC